MDRTRNALPLSRALAVIAALLLGSAVTAHAEDPPPLDGAPAPEAAPAAPAPVQPAPVMEVGDLPEAVVTATRVLTPEQIVPRAMTVVDDERILRRSVPSALDVLDDQIGVWIEKRTGHTSDPVIRGLSGTNILTLIDGNTLSTYWGEGGFAGDDMYGKIDPEMIERIEVVRGPSSVLYGSNALGGVINVITKASPFDWTSPGCCRVGSRTRLATHSNPGLLRPHQEIYGATPELRWWVGATLWDSGDIKDGGGQTQKPTGGHGAYANGRMAFKLGSRAVLDLTLQHTDNGKVHRYYRPTQDNSNLRTAIAAALEIDTSGRNWLADFLRLHVYYQDKRDNRRWFDAAGNVTRTGVAKWRTVALGLQARRDLPRHEITYGLAFESTEGESPDDEQFTVTPVGGTPSKPSPDAVWSSFGGYLQDRWKVTPRFTLTSAVRLDVLRFETDVDAFYVPAGGLPASTDEFTDYETALVGGVQANVHLTRKMDLYGGWTRGFRQFAPRFGVSQVGFGVIVPSQLLDPVTADQFEIGIKRRDRWLSGDVVAYYTRFRNFQNVVRGSFMGQDWYDFDGDTIRDANEDVYVTTGNGRAYVYGIEAMGSVNLAVFAPRLFGDAWSVSGGFAWNFGRDQTNDIPIRHTHPAWGRVALRYESKRARAQPWFEVAGQFVHRYTKIPPSRLSGDVGYLEDPQDPTSGMRRTWGLPGYSVLDVRGGFKVARNVTLVVGVDNVLDKLYRAAHSRMDAPGRGYYLTVDVEL